MDTPIRKTLLGRKLDKIFSSYKYELTLAEAKYIRRFLWMNFSRCHDTIGDILLNRKVLIHTTQDFDHFRDQDSATALCKKGVLGKVRITVPPHYSDQSTVELTPCLRVNSHYLNTLDPTILIGGPHDDMNQKVFTLDIPQEKALQLCSLGDIFSSVTCSTAKYELVHYQAMEVRKFLWSHFSRDYDTIGQILEDRQCVMYRTEDVAYLGEERLTGIRLELCEKGVMKQCRRAGSGVRYLKIALEYLERLDPTILIGGHEDELYKVYKVCQPTDEQTLEEAEEEAVEEVAAAFDAADAREQELEDRAYLLGMSHMAQVNNAMIKKGLTKQDLADATGIRKKHIKQIFQADRLIGFRELARMERALGLNFLQTGE